LLHLVGDLFEVYVNSLFQIPISHFSTGHTNTPLISGTLLAVFTLQCWNDSLYKSKHIQTCCWHQQA